MVATTFKRPRRGRPDFNRVPKATFPLHREALTNRLAFDLPFDLEDPVNRLQDFQGQRRDLPSSVPLGLELPRDIDQIEELPVIARPPAHAFPRAEERSKAEQFFTPTRRWSTRRVRRAKASPLRGMAYPKARRQGRHASRDRATPHGLVQPDRHHLRGRGVATLAHPFARI